MSQPAGAAAASELPAPREAPTTGLVVFTSCGLGLWMLSTAMLLLGSIGGAMLSGWLWWPIIAAGVLLAAWQGRRRMEKWPAPRVDVRTGCFWIVIAIAVGMWLAGAMRPPGTVGLQQADAYDVLEYHLQVPREYFQAGKITALYHNVYSYYPSGTEMLFLLGMCLRGGAYEGMYLATVIHGLFGAIAVAAIASSLGNGERRRGRFAAMLLATSPAILYLGWLALVELSQLMYLTLALLWLREWLDPLRIAVHRDAPSGNCGLRISTGSAACIGLMLGGACSVKYLSVGFVALPALVVMLIAASLVFRARHLRVWASLRLGVSLLGHVVIAGVLALALLSPWLIRDMAGTGNPVFPLATNIFGRGYLPAQEEQRWLAGHSPANNPPVPIPAGWEATPTPGRAHMLIDNFVKSIWLGPLAVAIIVIWLIVLTIRRFTRGRDGRSADRVAANIAATAPGAAPGTHAWDWALFGVLAIQVALWTAVTRGMPWRFLSPAIAEIALLAAGAMAAMAQLGGRALPDMASPATSARPRDVARGGGDRSWAAPLAGAVLGVLVLMNLWSTCSFFKKDTGTLATLPWTGQEIAGEQSPYSIAAGLPKGAKIMLVGESRAFYFPPGTIYATAFDPNPLAADIDAAKGDPQELLRRLRAAGVTHILVNWAEVWRLAATYGFPPQLTSGLWPAAQAGEPPRIEAMDGAKMPALKIEHFYRDADGDLTTRPAGTAVAAPPYWKPFDFPHGWPIITLYTLPE